MRGVSDPVGRVSELLTARKQRLAIAESCTGGMLAARFTDRPGASRFFYAGFVTYSDTAKQKLLGVDPATIADHGAVSEAVVGEMMEGALRGVDAALAVTGIAGPGGGTAEKPVGTVWIGAGVGRARVIRQFQFDGDRSRVREASVTAAVELLESLLEGES